MMYVKHYFDSPSSTPLRRHCKKGVGESKGLQKSKDFMVT